VAASFGHLFHGSTNMIHPLFRLIASQPQMLANHLEAYAKLVEQEVGTIATQWKRRALMLAIAAACSVLALIFTGVALLLWAAIPTSDMPAPWGLIAVPGVLIVAAVALVFAAKASSTAAKAFEKVRQQLAADAAMLREVNAS